MSKGQSLKSPFFTREIEKTNYLKKNVSNSISELLHALEFRQISVIRKVYEDFVTQKHDSDYYMYGKLY